MFYLVYLLLGHYQTSCFVFVVGISTVGGTDEITTSNSATSLNIVIGVLIFIVFIVLVLCAVMVMVAYIVYHAKKRYELLLLLLF